MTKVNMELLLARFNRNPPASREAIERVQDKLSFRLPRSYIDFLLTSDGGEGFVGNAYLMLWKVEELITRNATYVAEFAPMLFLFGSDGGGEAFAFDTRSDACEMVRVPFMDLELVTPLARDFEEFLSVLFAS